MRNIRDFLKRLDNAPLPWDMTPSVPMFTGVSANVNAGISVTNNGHTVYTKGSGNSDIAVVVTNLTNISSGKHYVSGVINTITDDGGRSAGVLALVNDNFDIHDIYGSFSNAFGVYFDSTKWQYGFMSSPTPMSGVPADGDHFVFEWDCDAGALLINTTHGSYGITGVFTPSDHLRLVAITRVQPLATSQIMFGLTSDLGGLMATPGYSEAKQIDLPFTHKPGDLFKISNAVTFNGVNYSNGDLALVLDSENNLLRIPASGMSSSEVAAAISIATTATLKTAKSNAVGAALIFG